VSYEYENAVITGHWLLYNIWNIDVAVGGAHAQLSTSPDAMTSHLTQNGGTSTTTNRRWV